MTGSIRGYTTSYRFIMPDYNVQGWHTYEYKNWQAIDALLNSFVQLLNFKGVWENSTPYILNDIAADSSDGLLYKCLVGNTSPATGSFLSYRTANPSHWTTVDQTAFDATSNRLMKRLRKMQQEANAINANAVRAYNMALVSVSAAAASAVEAQKSYIQTRLLVNIALTVQNEGNIIRKQLRAFNPANIAFYSQVYS